MFGWTVQRYGKVPAAVNVKLKLPPAARLPFHVPPFDVDVWATLSRLVQTTESGEVRITPDFPTATKSPLRNATP